MVEQRQIAERQRQAGNTAFKEQQYSEALRCYQAGLEVQRHSMALHANAAAAALKLNCYVQALEHCDKVGAISSMGSSTCLRESHTLKQLYALSLCAQSYLQNWKQQALQDCIMALLAAAKSHYYKAGFVARTITIWCVVQVAPVAQVRGSSWCTVLQADVPHGSACLLPQLDYISAPASWLLLLLLQLLPRLLLLLLL
jgi:tetratricopeptide (TPR) repeat protein